MTDKKMTDEEFKDELLSALSELHGEIVGFQDDLDVLRIALVLMANVSDVDPKELFKNAKQIQTLNALERLEEKEE